MSIIVGIDPGSNLLGYAFLQTQERNKPRLIAMGTLDMRDEESQAAKLHFIFEELQNLLKIYEPTQAAIEAPFYGKDVQAMLKLGRAQGVAMLTLKVFGLEPTEYSPRSVKKAVTGQGQASKEQVARMLPHLIVGDLTATTLDATDALGIAYCHYLSQQQTGLGAGKKYDNWAAFLKDNPKRKG